MIKNIVKCTKGRSAVHCSSFEFLNAFMFMVFTDLEINHDDTVTLESEVA